MSGTLGNDEKFCRSCGGVIKKAAAMCTKCGVSVSEIVGLPDDIHCTSCGETIKKMAVNCPKCGVPNQAPVAPSIKSRKTAFWLALLLGGLGVHKFYLGYWGWGIILLLLMMTGVSALIALVQAIRYWKLTDEEFAVKHAASTGAFGNVW